MSYASRHNTDAVVVDDTGMIIGPENAEEWAVYQAWLAAGNTPSPADPPPPAPAPFCSDLQFRLALNQEGLRAAVEAYVNNADQDTQDWYARSPTIRADNPRLLAAAAALGKTPADVEGLIALGKTLT